MLSDYFVFINFVLLSDVSGRYKWGIGGGGRGTERDRLAKLNIGTTNILVTDV